MTTHHLPDHRPPSAHVPPSRSLLGDVLAQARGAGSPSEGFAVLRRRGVDGVDVLVGEVVDVDTLAQIPQPADSGAVLAIVPFRQVHERGFECHDDGAPLRCLVAGRHERLSVADVVAAIPAGPVRLVDAAFDVDDDAYADVVKRVIADEIGQGQGANFVVRRDFVARLDGEPGAVLRPALTALTLFGHLLDSEPGAYWTFAVHAGDTTMVGATPERHVSVRGDRAGGGEVVMNPISGTFRYPPSGPTHAGLLSFLADPKENEELSMVVDEELKMMSEVCDRGGRVLGPRLVEMSRLTHTEYELVGRTTRDVREVLRATMFAATVTGSPVENACRIVSRYEGRGRGYYSGMAALLTSESEGRTSLDAPILIRTAYLGADGSVRVPVGATLVRHSVPESEVAETHAKAAGLLGAFGLSTGPRRGHPLVGHLAELPGVRQALARRNETLSAFWLQEQTPLPAFVATPAGQTLVGRTAVMVDAEDAWTTMLAHVLRHLGMTATVARWDDVALAGFDGALETADLVVAGPGPGDPRDVADARIAYLHMLLAGRLASRRPTLAVCLSHQVLAGLLGLSVGPLPSPYQGTQRRIRVFDRDVAMGFYNTFSAWAPPAAVDASGAFAHRYGSDPREVSGWAVPGTGEVLALQGQGFASVQFHLESVLSQDGVAVLGHLVQQLLA